jgi:hypothetical protein
VRVGKNQTAGRALEDAGVEDPVGHIRAAKDAQRRPRCQIRSEIIVGSQRSAFL